MQDMTYTPVCSCVCYKLYLTFEVNANACVHCHSKVPQQSVVPNSKLCELLI